MIRNVLLIAVFFSLSPSSAAEFWRGLVVEEENTCSPYDKKKQYPYPQSVEDDIVESMGGAVYGPYTGTYFTSDTETDIEHIVATSQAHSSRLCKASASVKKQFAQDLLNLTLAAPKVNRCTAAGKCDLDAGEWLPEMNKCWFAKRVLDVKTKYALSVDRKEADALEDILSNCDSFEMVFTARTSEPNLDRVDVTQGPLELYDDNGNGRISCKEARAHRIAPVTSKHPAYIFMWDKNNDGVVCE